MQFLLSIMNFCLLYLRSHLLKPSSVLSSDTLGYAVGRICASKPKVYFSLMHYTPTVRGQGTLYHGHSGTQTKKAATILNIASHHGWEKESSGGSPVSNECPLPEVTHITSSHNHRPVLVTWPHLTNRGPENTVLENVVLPHVWKARPEILGKQD